jgi:two-component system alkaline phosphatase synthesis response regulator PhoP
MFSFRSADTLEDGSSGTLIEGGMPRRRVLVVDDDRNIVQLVRMYLEKDNYQVSVAYDGEEALDAMRAFKPDIVVLDLMLPGVDGVEVCKRIRWDSDVPIIMLTARTTEAEKLFGLDLGADDYVTKPFSPRELLARMRAVLRRAPGAEELGGPEELAVGPLVIYPRRREVVVQERPVSLTPTEFNLLKVMAMAPGQVFTRAQLIGKAFGHDFEGFERNVDVHITSLRRKLEADMRKGTLIKTVYGTGYKLEPDVEAMTAHA